MSTLIYISKWYNKFMQLQRQNSQIVSRIVKDKNGQEFQAWFLVMESSGRFFAKLIKLEKINEGKIFSQSEKILLEGISCRTCFEVDKNFGENIESPYIKLDFFFKSQMTRAPSSF